MKKTLNATDTKTEFIKSIHHGICKILDDNGNGKYKDMLIIDGSSILFNLPDNYFNCFDIPKGTKIEMKFITKRN